MNQREYREMLAAINAFKAKHNRQPNYYTYQNLKLKILKPEYTDAIRRFNTFVKKNNRKPSYVKVKGQYLTLKPKYVTSGVVGLISAKMHVNINDYKTLYTAFKNAEYSYYYNDKYAESTAIKRLKTGLNCTDMNQLAYAALLQLGYTAEIVRGTVECNGESYGHVWNRIKLNGKWVNYDVTAIAKYGRSIGGLICTGEWKVTNINPSWATRDDGIT